MRRLGRAVEPALDWFPDIDLLVSVDIVEEDKMLDPSNWTETNLNDLIRNDVQEDQHLDYKRSEALARSDQCRTELSKDVAAFANSDGGLIIYGIEERDHHPNRIDDGVDAVHLNREWLEQITTSNIHPRIDGLKIHPIPLPSKGKDRIAYVIDIPQSASRAPHQLRDKKYYRRYNFHSVAMEDYKIGDVLRRASAPDLFIRFSFDAGSSTRVKYQPPQKTSQPILLIAEIGNRSNTPAQHALIKIYLDQWFHPELMQGLKFGGNTTRDGRGFRFYTVEWCVPPRLPIFAEAMLPITEKPMMFSIEEGQLGIDFNLGYEIRAPGFTKTDFVHVVQIGGTLFMPKRESG